MKVVGLYDRTGPAFHRIYIPLAGMPDTDVVLTNRITEEMYEQGFDVLFFNRIPPANKLSEILNRRKELGFKIVVDLDDHWNLDPHHILADTYQHYNLSTYILTAVNQADAVTVTHERLAESASAYNRNVWVLPNAIDPQNKHFRYEWKEGKRVRLFWAGGITHEKDISLLRGPLRRVYADSQLREQIMMIMGGYNKHPAWDAMVASYTNGLRLPGHILNGRDVEEYYSMYELADICLVPLQDTRFNSHKSNLKILEAANAGLPVIVSRCHPYLDFPEELVNYVSRQTDWYKYIRHLVMDETYRKAQGQALKEYCATVYNFDMINAKRKELFESLINQPHES